MRGTWGASAVELAKDWRTDRMLRHLEALLIVMRPDGDVCAEREWRRDRAG